MVVEEEEEEEEEEDTPPIVTVRATAIALEGHCNQHHHSLYSSISIWYGSSLSTIHNIALLELFLTHCFANTISSCSPHLRSIMYIMSDVMSTVFLACLELPRLVCPW
jgi:hypothetical protein